MDKATRDLRETLQRWPTTTTTAAAERPKTAAHWWLLLQRRSGDNGAQREDRRKKKDVRGRMDGQAGGKREEKRRNKASHSRELLYVTSVGGENRVTAVGREATSSRVSNDNDTIHTATSTSTI